MTEPLGITERTGIWRLRVRLLWDMWKPPGGGWPLVGVRVTVVVREAEAAEVELVEAWT